MPNAVVVQYRTRADAAEANRGLIEAVFEELRDLRPAGFSYMAFALEDGVGFLHVAVAESDENPLPQVAGGGFAKFGDLGVGLGGGSDHVEPGDAAIEPEAGDVREIGGGDFRVEVEQDADVAAASFVDEVVEIVESPVDGVEGLGVGRVGLERGEKESVNTEGVNVVETLGDTVESAAAARTEVNGVYFVDDGTFPPDVCGDAGAGPAGTGKDLGFGASA